MNVIRTLANRDQENEFRARLRRCFKKTAASATQAIVLSLVATGPILAGDVPAFPGAEGYGAKTAGGRGGRIIAVTNLDPSGPGSLREACEASGPRIVVFKVVGTIDGDIRIKNDHITIAGQTAPGDGITIKGTVGIDANDVVIRYIRVRTDHEGDALGGRYRKNIILDHVSASWSTDEVLSLYHNENVTIQWCMITEACAKEDGSHRFGGIWGNQYGTYHHNLIAHNDSRNPRWASGCGYNDYRNNVLYNWGYESSYGGEARQKGDRRNPPIEFSTINMIANYYKPGPGTRSDVRDCIASPSSRGDDDYGSWYVADNFVDGFPDVTAENQLGLRSKTFTRLDSPWDAIPIHQQAPQDAYASVLDHAGCSLSSRDVVDRRIIEEVRSGTATHGKNGIITTPEEVGGWPKLQSAEAPQDSDSDGMPDHWEKRYGLNANNANDNSSDVDGDGYTNVEEWLNGTDPTEFVDYTKSEMNINTLEKLRGN
ncbi:MAG: hypothetical protein KDB05_06070 [Planctomycetales bacterium]|nr:hypothetical protein [Planctomycetales bacterium]